MPLLPPKSSALERPRSKLRHAAFLHDAEVVPAVMQLSLRRCLLLLASGWHMWSLKATPGVRGCIFAKQQEDAEPARLVGLWVECARLVAPDTTFLAQLGQSRAEAVSPFLDRALSTLKRHLFGWRVWATFCLTMGWRRASRYVWLWLRL